MDLAAQIAVLNIEPALRNAVLAQLALVDKQADKIESDKLTIEHLTFELSRLRRIRFDKTSEVLSAVQVRLFDEAIDEDFAAIEVEIEQLQPKPRQPRTNAGRQTLPAHLPRNVIVHAPQACQCGQCGDDLVQFGVDVSEKLHFTPGTFSVERHERPKFKCNHCERIVTAPVPAAVIDGGMPTNALLAWVIICKYVDHLPLYRISQMAERSGVHLSRQTLAEWTGKSSVALSPVAQRLCELLKQSDVLHADETPIRQLDPGNGKTHPSYMWAYRNCAYGGDPPIVVFDYQTSRAGKHARQFLDGWQGTLMVDDYSGYKAMFANGVTELGCWAHARRKFFDVHVANKSPIAAEALQRIAKLYAVEQAAKGLDNEARLVLRQEQALPLLTDLHDWLVTTRVKTPDGTKIAKAIDYTIKRWPALIRYVESGAFPIDNNPVENAIRPIAIGKKNWLFVGSERAGKRAADIQSLLATAKANGVEQHAWLVDVLDKLPTWPNSKIDELLPLKKSNDL